MSTEKFDARAQLEVLRSLFPKGKERIEALSELSVEEQLEFVYYSYYLLSEVVHALEERMGVH